MSTTPLPPDMQQAVERLFEMFSAYVAARTAREKRIMHRQILELFSRLGVVSDSALVRRAADMFERIKREPTPPRVHEVTLSKRAGEFVASRLRIFERTPGSPELSQGARQLLRIPVVEATEFTLKFDPEQTAKSLDTILATLVEPPATAAEGTARVRTSIAVVRGFSKNFCRIPPFCSG